MGARDYFYTLDGKTTPDAVRRSLRDQQDDDCDYNGDRDGYSGDSQTVNSIRVENTEFTDENEAREYILDHAEKWEYFIAVRVKQGRKKAFWLVGGWAAE